MEFKFDVIDLGVILSALKKYDSPMSRELWVRLKQQYMDQKDVVASVAKDSADDGPEVDLIRFFKVFPEGKRWPTLERIQETPMQTTTRFWERIWG